MWSHYRMLKSVRKIVRVIKSCKTSEHCAACKRLINNFKTCHKSTKRSNKLLINSYCLYLNQLLNDKRVDILSA